MSLLLPVFTSVFSFEIYGVNLNGKRLKLIAMRENEEKEIECVYEINRSNLSKEKNKLIAMKENKVYVGPIQSDNHIYYYNPHLFERFVTNIGKWDVPIRKFISDCLGVKLSNVRPVVSDISDEEISNILSLISSQSEESIESKKNIESKENMKKEVKTCVIL